jgi:hypothetical protein
MKIVTVELHFVFHATNLVDSRVSIDVRGNDNASRLLDVERSFEILGANSLGSQRRSRFGLSRAQPVGVTRGRSSTRAFASSFSVLNNEEVFKTARLWERYEKPFRKRSRLCYEK